MALEGVEGIEGLVVDTTGRAVFRTAEGVKPPEEAMNEKLKSASDAFKVRKLQRLKLEPAVAVATLRLDGFG